MEVRHDEGVANRIGPEPCIAGRGTSGEEGTGQPLSRDRNILGADAWLHCLQRWRRKTASKFTAHC